MPRNSQEEARKARARKDKEKPRSGQEKARNARKVQEKPRNGQEEAKKPRARRIMQNLRRCQEGHDQECQVQDQVQHLSQFRNPHSEIQPSDLQTNLQAERLQIQIQLVHFKFQICKGRAKGDQDGMFIENALVRGHLGERRKWMVGRAEPGEHLTRWAESYTHLCQDNPVSLRHWKGQEPWEPEVLKGRQRGTLGPRTKRHIRFVSNLSGTSMVEIGALSFLFPALLVLCKCHQGYLNAETKGNKGRTRCIWSVIVDFTFVVIPTLSILTILNSKVYPLTAVTGCGLLLAFWMRRRRLEDGNIFVKDKQHEKPPKLQFLSSYRFVVMLLTCLSILAVDFNIFPRRYAKTETYGTGLMDIGVGSFVVVNAIVSRKARGLHTSEWKGHVLQNTGPLFLLGFARLLFTKQVDYQACRLRLFCSVNFYEYLC
ncbi:hypothetical protein L7F22_025870 [Adiantum nelumboides]|nr:hypothetical protein [Adiantum nelumboides]